MFSGIIQAEGKITVRIDKEGVTQFAISAPHLSAQHKEIGNSIAVNGCCVTVTSTVGDDFTVDCSEETLRLTNFAVLQVGDLVNLEPAMTLQTALHGHLVSGHVDGVGTLKKVKGQGESLVIEVEVPDDCMRYMVKKGSITLNGISLTINEVSSHSVTMCIIPHTWQVTNLRALTIGAPLNIEIDMIARYLERLLQAR